MKVVAVVTARELPRQDGIRYLRLDQMPVCLVGLRGIEGIVVTRDKAVNLDPKVLKELGVPIAVCVPPNRRIRGNRLVRPVRCGADQELKEALRTIEGVRKEQIRLQIRGGWGFY